jgi:hypothetical protein
MSDPNQSSPVYLYPEWQPQVQAALLELDLVKLAERIQTAEAAITARLHSISLNPNHHAERLAISDALATLKFLKREYTNQPRPAS